MFIGFHFIYLCLDPFQTINEISDEKSKIKVKRLESVLSELKQKHAKLVNLERLKKIRSHRGIRHWWGLKVRGQHTKTSRRRGRR